MHDGGIPLDMTTIKDELDKTKSLASIGGIEYLAKIVESVSNAANLLFRGWRDFKRSELNAYLSSNVTLLSRINDESNYPLLNRFKLYIPEGMVGKYPDAFQLL